MKRVLIAVGLAACLAAPLAVWAQTIPSQPGAAASPSARSAMREQFEAIRQRAHTTAYNALTPAHRTQVQTIVTQVTAGSLAPRDAVQQINALLGPNEQQAVLAAAQQQRDDMRAAFAQSGMTPPAGRGGPSAGAGAGPGGPPPPGANGAHARQPNAGAFLLRVSLTPEQMRALRRQGQGTGAPTH